MSRRAPPRVRSLPTAPPPRPGPRRARRRRSPRRAAHLHPRPPNAADGCSACREQRVRRVRVPRLVPARRTRRGNRSTSAVRSGSGMLAPVQRCLKAGTAQQVLVPTTRAVPEFGGRCDRGNRTRTLGILFQPAVETRPRRRDRLVSDGHLIAVGREQAGRHETIEDSAPRRVSNQGSQHSAAPHGRAVRAAMHEAEHERATRIGVGVVEGTVKSLGRLRDRTGDPARGSVPRDSQGRTFASDPGLDQGVGHMWKRRAAVAGIPDDHFHEPRLKTQSRALSGALNRLAKPVDRATGRSRRRRDRSRPRCASYRWERSRKSLRRVMITHAPPLRRSATTAHRASRSAEPKLEDRFGLVYADHVGRYLAVQCASEGLRRHPSPPSRPRRGAIR